MAGEIQVTVVGNIAADPEMKFLPSGKAVAQFSLASTPRTQDKQSNEWVDGEPTWFRVTVWGRDAENVAESFVKGNRVVVVGRLVTETWTGQDGTQRSSLKLTADEVAASTKFAQVKVTKGERGGGAQPQQQRQQRPQPVDDPWAPAGGDEQPPF